MSQHPSANQAANEREAPCIVDRTDIALSVTLTTIMVLQAVSGRLFPEVYLDPELVRATWLGNDWVTLLVAAPLLLAATLSARRGHAGGVLLWFGALAYGVYNYAFYMLGAVLNELFVIYVVAFVLSVVTLIRGFIHTDVAQIARSFRRQTPRRALGSFLIFVAVGLSLVWVGMWAGHVFKGSALPVEEPFFRLVAALDLGLMVPALATGGALLFRDHPLGFLLGPTVAIQGALYLFVLTVNSTILMNLGLEEPPGQAPIWGALCLATSIAVAVFLRNLRDEQKLEKTPQT